VLDNQIANVKPFGRRPSLTYTELLFGGSGKWPQRLKADADLRSPAFAVILRSPDGRLLDSHWKPGDVPEIHALRVHRNDEERSGRRVSYCSTTERRRLTNWL